MCYLAYLKQASEVSKGSDIFFFREREVPMWENSVNGGIWIYRPKEADNTRLQWELLLMALAGEQFGSDSQIIGASLVTKTGRHEQLI